jgi:P27 family predicted phage terminase small subunit
MGGRVAEIESSRFVVAKGRKPTPKPILQMRGSRVRGPHKSGIDAPPGVPSAPGWLCDIAREEWERILPMLEASKVMSPRHQQTLACYCDSFADMVQADAELKEGGTTIVDEKGRVSNHPAWLRKRDARNQMLKFASEFGLTASALARVSAVENAPKEDDEDRLMFG